MTTSQEPLHPISPGCILAGAILFASTLSAIDLGLDIGPRPEFLPQLHQVVAVYTIEVALLSLVALAAIPWVSAPTPHLRLPLQAMLGRHARNTASPPPRWERPGSGSKR